MKFWRLAIAIILVLTIGVPLAMPFVELARHGEGWQVWSEGGRVASMAWNTLRLVLGTLVLALPLGIAGAVLLERTDVPCRGLWRWLAILALFVPLPLFASAWQATLGTGGMLPSTQWNTVPANDPDVTASGTGWKPWAYGMNAAIWVHAVAAIPWVILIVGQGLRWVEPELEEDGLLAASPLRVLFSVTLRRAGVAIVAAGLWVVLQAATEITITDMMQVRTFAEEVYYQFVLGDRAALARSVAVNLPPIVLLGVVVVWMARRLEARLPPLEERTRPPLVFSLEWLRWPAFAGVVLVVLVLLGVPLVSLIWKAGSAGGATPFSPAIAWRNFAQVFLGKASELAGRSLAMATAAGFFTATFALVCCWYVVESRRAIAYLMLAVLILALPGPVLGLGLKDTIQALMNLEEAIGSRVGLSAFHPFRALLYDGYFWIPGNPQDLGRLSEWKTIGPSPLPILWVAFLRFFPFALAVLWPVVRLFPGELRAAARMDGARPMQELRHLGVPLLAPAAIQAGLGVAILSLGEVSAGKLVETPGTQTFAHELFTQMHYGVQDRLAALCLALLTMVALGGSAVVVVGRLLRRDAPAV
jgi:iron(III) transport system permease protein